MFMTSTAASAASTTRTHSTVTPERDRGSGAGTTESGVRSCGVGRAGATGVDPGRSDSAIRACAAMLISSCSVMPWSWTS